MMKSVYLSLFSGLLFILGVPLAGKAQYTVSIATGPVTYYVYIGTLNMTENDQGNYQKIKTDLFGGGWTSDGLGVTTFYIGNRGGLTVHQTTVGSSDSNTFSVQAYANSSNSNIDFYVVTNPWSAFWARSLKFGGSDAGNINVTTSTTVPAGTPLTLNVVPVMITDNVGNIGFNTVAPDPGYRVSVNGNIRAKEITVETGWADYVFEKDYYLTSLKDVKTYIDQNHHLPEIPSAAQVAKEGINLGEMNTKLLKKIEELTLYLIENERKQLLQGSKLKKQAILLSKLSNKVKRLETSK